MLEATFWIVAALLAQAQGTADYYGAYDPAGEAVYNRAPNAFLAESVRGVKPGAALDVGMGAGRNALYLAGLGWDVTGFDIAEAGVRQARERAGRLGLRLNAVVAHETDFDFGTNRWDLVVLTYQPLRHLLDRVKQGLKPGGVVVVENFQRDTKRYRMMGDGGMFDVNELTRLFSDFRILRYEDVAAAPDWGIEFPENRLVRLLARKGGAPEPGCDWKGSPKTAGDEVSWGSFRLRCTTTGWETVKP